jgi:hypothetical protein
MVGARRPDDSVHYPVNDLAARYGASVAEPTSDAAEAYAGWEDTFQRTKLDWPPA